MISPMLCVNDRHYFTHRFINQNNAKTEQRLVRKQANPEK